MIYLRRPQHPTSSVERMKNNKTIGVLAFLYHLHFSTCQQTVAVAN
jgi:hypothetical protein